MLQVLPEDKNFTFFVGTDLSRFLKGRDIFVRKIRKESDTF
jgi:hypothetical protein